MNETTVVSYLKSQLILISLTEFLKLKFNRSVSFVNKVFLISEALRNQRLASCEVRLRAHTFQMAKAG